MTFFLNNWDWIVSLFGGTANGYWVVPRVVHAVKVGIASSVKAFSDRATDNENP